MDAPVPATNSASLRAAEQAPPGDAWGSHGTYGRLYDPSTVVTLRGEVVRVEHVTPTGGASIGVHLIMSIDGGGNLAVHLGPAWFIEHQEFAIQPGDRLEITGSRVTVEGAQVVIARSVVKGDTELVLRDENGFPRWSASRRGPGR